MTQTVLSIAFGLTTIVALIVAVRLAKRKKPVWAYETTKILGLGTDAPPQLKLTFNNSPITDIYQTRFIFFNKGNESIRKGDVTEKVTIQFEAADILQPPTVKASREAIRLSAKQTVKDDTNSIEMDFLYLDHNDGAVVEVIHTSIARITCSGNIIGTKRISYIGKFKPTRLKWWLLLLKLIFPTFITGIAIFMTIEFVRRLITGEALKGIEPWMYVMVMTFVPLIVWSEVIPLFEYRKFPQWSIL